MPKLFAGTITGATQAELDAPNFKVCVENWRGHSDRIGLVVGRDARVPEIGGMEIYRCRTPEIMLNDVVAHAVNIVGDNYGRIIVTDPLIRYGKKTGLVHEIVERNQLGNAWACTSLSIIIDGPDGGSAMETMGLRWFLATGNVWTVTLSELRSKNREVPFVSPLWGGVIGAAFKDTLQPFKWFDVSDAHQVAWYPDVKVEMPTTTGYGALDFVPPSKTYLNPEAVLL